MLHVYYCSCCDRFFYIQYEVHTECRGCFTPMYKVNLSFSDFFPLDFEERYDYLVNDYLESDHYREIYEAKRRRDQIVKRRFRRLENSRKRDFRELF